MLQSLRLDFDDFKYIDDIIVYRLVANKKLRLSSQSMGNSYELNIKKGTKGGYVDTLDYFDDGFPSWLDNNSIIYNCPGLHVVNAVMYSTTISDSFGIISSSTLNRAIISNSTAVIEHSIIEAEEINIDKPSIVSYANSFKSITVSIINSVLLNCKIYKSKNSIATTIDDKCIISNSNIINTAIRVHSLVKLYYSTISNSELILSHSIIDNFMIDSEIFNIKLGLINRDNVIIKLTNGKLFYAKSYENSDSLVLSNDNIAIVNDNNTLTSIALTSSLMGLNIPILTKIDIQLISKSVGIDILEALPSKNNELEEVIFDKSLPEPVNNEIRQLVTKRVAKQINLNAAIRKKSSNAGNTNEVKKKQQSTKRKQPTREQYAKVTTVRSIAYDE